jgi:hypothetical protein
MAESSTTNSYGLVVEFLNRINFSDPAVSIVGMSCFVICFIAFLVYRSYSQSQTLRLQSPHPSPTVEGMDYNDVIKLIASMLEETTRSVHEMNSTTEKFCDKIDKLEDSFNKLYDRIDRVADTPYRGPPPGRDPNTLTDTP